MAFISNISNFFLNAIVIAEPTGVWEKIIMAFHNGIPNYAWAIIVFTLVLKVVLLPLDFFNRKITAKNTKLQTIVQPEIQKIQKKYGNNKQIINQKTMEIYKKYNYNVTGSCVIMLVNMALTLFIFITLFSGLNSMAAYKVGYQYQEMEKTYNEYAYGISIGENGEEINIETDYEKYINAYNAQKDIIKTNAENDKKNEIIISHAEDETPYDFNTNATDEEREEVTKAGEDAIALESNIELMKTAGETEAGKTEETIISEINAAVLDTYSKVKNNWLWIDNVWKSDVPWKESATSYDEFISLTKITYKTELGEGEETFYTRLEVNKETDEQTYENVTAAVKSESRVNGYLIIPILAVAMNVLSMLATQGKLKLPNKKKKEEVVIDPENPPKKQPGGWLMLVLIPALMGYITISYNAVFGLYILMSSVVSVAATPLINWGVKKLEEREDKKKKEKVEVGYKR